MLFLLLLLFVVALVPLIWAVFRVSRLSFEDVRGQIVDPEQVPESVLQRLKAHVEPLIETGFEYQGMRQEARGDAAYWQVVLSSAEGMVWAVAEESDQEGEGRRVSLLSFSSDGAALITRDGDFSFAEKLPDVVLQSDSFPSALEQAQSHAALLSEQEMAITPIQPDVFLIRYERLMARSLDFLFQRGWLREVRDQKLKIPIARLPQVALVWLKNELKVKRRVKDGSSWLLAGETDEAGETALVTEEEERDQEAAEPVSEVPHEGGEEVSGGAEVLEEVAAEVSDEVPELALASSLPVVDSLQGGEAEELEDVVATALAANQAAIQDLQVEALPVGPIDEGTPEVLEVDDAVSDESVEEVEQAVSEEAASSPVFEIPEEDGLARDWALYQQRASQKSWLYWLGGFGGRAFLFVTLLLFSIWMALGNGWGLRIVLFGLIALFVHEAGHALMMLLRRSLDWSHFLIPVPRAMKAKQWPIRGGWSELMTVLAGPFPGLIVGWVIFGRAYQGVPTSDLMLDLALAAVVVNGFTLLPFLPLDGGRLLDLGVLRRMPQLRCLGLFLSGLVFVALALTGWGLIGFVLALLMWLSIPAAIRKSKLLPWFRANKQEGEEAQVVTAFSISRERSQRKVFKGASGVARLDEMMGLGQASRLGFFGGLIALGCLVFSWVAPLVIPASGIVANAQEWFGVQGGVKAQSQEYLGALRPVTYSTSIGDEKKAEVEADALSDLAVWQERLAGKGGRSREVFSDELDLNAARAMKWAFVAHWIAEDPSKRHPVAHEAVLALRSEAIRSADNGEEAQAFRDLSKALRIIIECEPRHSLEAWSSWLALEREVLKEVEDVSSRYELADGKVQWYEGALALCPQPTPKKIAGLILADTPGFTSLVAQFGEAGLFPSSSVGGPGEKFLSVLRGFGELVSVESLEEQAQLAEVFAQSSSLEQASASLKASGKLTPELKKRLQLINNHFSFRQIAMSALKVKRVGMVGAAEDLKVLRENYGYTARLDETNERKALKLSRLAPSGEVVEKQWLLQQ